MADRISEHINNQLREVRARTFRPDDHAGINAALREAAGYGPSPEPQPQGRQQQPTTDPRTASRRLLAEAAAGVRDSEPVTGPARAWDEWVWSRPVISLLDQDGRLPGERGYDAGTTGLAIGQPWDVEQAIDSRRQRWQRTFGGTP
jgi:hypothetical protein